MNGRELIKSQRQRRVQSNDTHFDQQRYKRTNEPLNTKRYTNQEVNKETEEREIHKLIYINGD